MNFSDISVRFTSAEGVIDTALLANNIAQRDDGNFGDSFDRHCEYKYLA